MGFFSTLYNDASSIVHTVEGAGERVYGNVKADLGVAVNDVKRVEQSVVGGVGTAYSFVKKEAGAAVTGVENVGSGIFNNIGGFIVDVEYVALAIGALLLYRNFSK